MKLIKIGDTYINMDRVLMIHVTKLEGVLFEFSPNFKFAVSPSKEEEIETLHLYLTNNSYIIN